MCLFFLDGYKVLEAHPMSADGPYQHSYACATGELIKTVENGTW